MAKKIEETAKNGGMAKHVAWRHGGRQSGIKQQQQAWRRSVASTKKKNNQQRNEAKIAKAAT